MVPFNIVDGPVPGDLLHDVCNVTVPRIDIAIVAMVEFEDISKDKDHVCPAGHVPYEAGDEGYPSLILSFQMDIGEEDNSHWRVRYFCSASRQCLI